MSKTARWRRTTRRRIRGFLTVGALVVVALGMIVVFAGGRVPGVADGAHGPSISASGGPSASTAEPAETGAPASRILAADVPDLLRVADETRSPKYSRDRFDHWIDADGDGCNTRYEVLIEESTTPVTVTGRCWIDGGTWVSPLDGMYARSPGEIEIDHHVPLAEAWRSGASAWTDHTRRDFANDLGVPYGLTAASSVSNQSKGDKDPAEWLPTNTAYTCEYVLGWSLVKYRWTLAVDPAELAAIRDVLSGECGAIAVTLPEVRA